MGFSFFVCLFPGTEVPHSYTVSYVLPSSFDHNNSFTVSPTTLIQSNLLLSWMDFSCSWWPVTSSYLFF